MSSKTKEMYIITEMYELSENDRPKESSFIQPHVSSIRSKKDRAANEQQTDLDVDILAPIPVPSVEGWLQLCKYLQFVEALFLDPVSDLFKANQETTWLCNFTLHTISHLECIVPESKKWCFNKGSG